MQQGEAPKWLRSTTISTVDLEGLTAGNEDFGRTNCVVHEHKEMPDMCEQLGPPNFNLRFVSGINTETNGEVMAWFQVSRIWFRVVAQTSAIPHLSEGQQKKADESQSSNLFF